MANYCAVGPLGYGTSTPVVDKGTLSCTASPITGPMNDATGKREFDRQYELLQASLANVGFHAAYEGRVRALYGHHLPRYRDQVYAQVRAGTLSWREAAEHASELRNTSLNVMRGQSTAVGRTIAEALKREGRTFDELTAKYTAKKFGSSAQFEHLSSAKKNIVYDQIIEASGRPDARLMRIMRGVGYAGRGILLVSLGMLVYDVYTAEDKGRALAKGGSVLSAGVGGGILGGAAAGAICGPAVWICAVAGAAVGGIGAAYGVEMMWDK